MKQVDKSNVSAHNLLKDLSLKSGFNISKSNKSTNNTKYKPKTPLLKFKDSVTPKKVCIRMHSNNTVNTIVGAHSPINLKTEPNNNSFISNPIPMPNIYNSKSNIKDMIEGDSSIKSSINSFKKPELLKYASHSKLITNNNNILNNINNKDKSEVKTNLSINVKNMNINVNNNNNNSNNFKTEKNINIQNFAADRKFSILDIGGGIPLISNLAKCKTFSKYNFSSR